MDLYRGGVGQLLTVNVGVISGNTEQGADGCVIVGVTGSVTTKGVFSPPPPKWDL